MKPLTYIKIQGGEMLATDEEQPIYPMGGTKPSLDDFNDSFVKVGNADFVLGYLYIHGGEAVKVGDLITGLKDGLYPVSGLQFEVEEQYYHDYDDAWYPTEGLKFGTMRTVAIVSLIESKSEPSVSKEKEELRKIFLEKFPKHHFTHDPRRNIFDFFYSEIEQRASRIKALESANTILKGALEHQRKKSKALEERLIPQSHNKLKAQ